MKKLISLIIFFYTSFSFAGEVFYVKVDGNDSNDGKSWETAFADVQTAIDAAYTVATDENPSEVWIATGTYKHGSSLTMKNNVAIYGGFSGYEKQKDERKAEDNETIFDGESLYCIISNTYSENEQLTSSSKIDTISLKNGNGKNNGNGGGAIYNWYASPVISNCKFYNNISSHKGGAISLCYSASKIIKCTFIKNQALGNNSSDGGGAISNYYAESVIENCLFQENKTNSYGGAIKGATNLSNSVFIANNASTGGGGICTSKNAIIENCMFVENTANTGGGLYSAETNVSIKSSTFEHNVASNMGGGMYVSGYAPIIVNCTFYKNNATSYGSGILFSDGNPSLISSTFFSNLSDSNGGCIAVGRDYNQYLQCTPKIVDSIFWGNEKDFTPFAVSSRKLSNCIIQSELNDNSNTNPLFGDYGYYGGMVKTIPVLQGSSAITMGTTGEEVPATDARGFQRSKDKPTIGAFEYIEPIITLQPVSTEVYIGKTCSFRVAGTGLEGIRYQWQFMDNLDTWTDIDGETSSTLIFLNCNIESNGTKYRCILSNKIDNSSIISNVATLTVYKTLEITEQPQDIYVFDGDSGTFTVKLDAHGDVAYQWQQNINGIWFDIENETSESLTISDMTESKDGIQYRVIIKNGGDTFESAPATLNFAYPISITKQPNIIPVAYIGKTVTFSVKTTGYVEEYQWFVSTNYGTDTPIEIPNANANTLTLHVNDDTILESVYYCVIKNAKTDLETDWVYIEEVREPTKFILWADENGLSGDNANALATPFNDGITNIEKFAFGLSGNKAASYSENALFKQSYADGKACFQFPISKDAADSVNVKVMTSEDLVNWVEAEFSNIGESGDFNLMQTEQPIPEGGKLFFKLIVEEK